MFFFESAENEVGQDAEDESDCDSRDLNFAEGEHQSADTGDEDCADNEEVAVVVEVDVFNHLETADCDKAVQCDAGAAHYAFGNRRYEGYERREEGQNDATDSSAEDCPG